MSGLPADTAERHLMFRPSNSKLVNCVHMAHGGVAKVGLPSGQGHRSFPPWTAVLCYRLLHRSQKILHQGRFSYSEHRSTNIQQTSTTLWLWPTPVPCSELRLARFSASFTLQNRWWKLHHRFRRLGTHSVAGFACCSARSGTSFVYHFVRRFRHVLPLTL